MWVLDSEKPVDALDEIVRGKKTMQKEYDAKRSSAARTIAIDERELLLRHRLFQLLAMMLAAATALGIYQIFIR